MENTKYYLLHPNFVTLIEKEQPDWKEKYNDFMKEKMKRAAKDFENNYLHEKLNDLAQLLNERAKQLFPGFEEEKENYFTTELTLKQQSESRFDPPKTLFQFAFQDTFDEKIERFEKFKAEFLEKRLSEYQRFNSSISRIIHAIKTQVLTRVDSKYKENVFYQKFIKENLVCHERKVLSWEIEVPKESSLEFDKRGNFIGYKPNERLNKISGIHTIHSIQVTPELEKRIREDEGELGKIAFAAFKEFCEKIEYVIKKFKDVERCKIERKLKGYSKSHSLWNRYQYHIAEDIDHIQNLEFGTYEFIQGKCYFNFDFINLEGEEFEKAIQHFRLWEKIRLPLRVHNQKLQNEISLTNRHTDFTDFSTQMSEEECQQKIDSIIRLADEICEFSLKPNYDFLSTKYNAEIHDLLLRRFYIEREFDNFTDPEGNLYEFILIRGDKKQRICYKNGVPISYRQKNKLVRKIKQETW